MLHLVADDCDVRGSCGVGYSVINKIAEDAVDEACVALHFHMLGHLYGWRDMLFVQLKRCVFEHVLYDGTDVNLQIRLPGVCTTVVHLVKFGECTHVKQQFGHAFTLRIAALQKVFFLIFGHVGMIQNALQITVNAGGRRLQFVGGILCQLALDAYLVLLRMAEFPIKHNDGMADVA